MINLLLTKSWPKDLHVWCSKEKLFASNSLDKLFKIFPLLCKYLPCNAAKVTHELLIKYC